VDSCPYGTIYFNEDLNIAQKCTGCAHLLDNGWTVTRCADVCPTEALRFGEESEFKDLISKAEILNPEYNAKPRVYYLNLPKKFVAGTLYDPKEKEVIIGATCTLTDTTSGEKFTATTDNFGDFWFNDMKESLFSLKIESNGKAKTIESISTEKDVNLGDIPLSQ
jgi:ferredoxin